MCNKIYFLDIVGCFFHPENIEPLSESMRVSVNALIDGVEIDLDAPLLDEDE